MIDYSYTEIKPRVIEVFESAEAKKHSIDSTEVVYFYAENDEEPDMFLTVLGAVVYEVKHNILTDRLKANFIQYAERWDKGEFQKDLLPEDIPIIQKDIDFIRSKISN